MGINAGMEQETIQIWLKQLCQHWSEQYYKLLKLRKESSIPGSVVPHDAAGVLFEKEDLQQAKLVQTVNFASGKKFKGFVKNDSYKWGKFNAPKGGRFRSWGPHPSGGISTFHGVSSVFDVTASTGRGTSGYGSQGNSRYGNQGGQGYGSQSGRGRGKQGAFFTPAVECVSHPIPAQAEGQSPMVGGRRSQSSSATTDRCRGELGEGSSPRVKGKAVPAARSRSAGLLGVLQEYLQAGAILEVGSLQQALPSTGY